MTQYVDAFVVPVPNSGMAAYRRMARKAGKIWIEHGALQYRECVAEDVKAGTVSSFPQSVQLEDDETVVLAWITYKSRKHRDSVMAKVMADPRLADKDGDQWAPFDVQRMFWGGFKGMVEL